MPWWKDMPSILGPAPILDFDGTLAVLPVDWKALRKRLGVASIELLWAGDDAGRWDAVTEAELAAAATAEPVAATVRSVEAALAFTVLSSNSEGAIAAFLLRFPMLARRCRLVAGRETIAGSKRDPDHFAAAFRTCRDATAAERSGGPVVYLGDSAFELELATALGAVALHVDDLRG
jgi:hypothetical protein